MSLTLTSNWNIKVLAVTLHRDLYVLLFCRGAAKRAEVAVQNQSAILLWVMTTSVSRIEIMGNQNMFKKIFIGISFVAVTFLSTTTMAEDGVEADPEHYTVEFENDKVRVIRIKYGPGEKSVMHTHGPNVSVFLTSNAVRFTLPDGTSVDVNAEAGGAQWADAEEHLPENLSDDPLEVVLVELKE